MPLKGNRKVALTAKDKKEGRYVKSDTIIPEPDSMMTIYLEGVEFPLLLPDSLPNEDGSTAVLYLVTSDMTLDMKISPPLSETMEVEEFHKSLKQNTSLAISYHQW
jgi:hypothetical protein